MREISPKLKPFIDAFNAAVPALMAAGYKATAVNAREWLANTTRDLVTDIPEIEAVWDEVVPTHGYNVPIRIYHPAPSEQRPVLIHYHGGGHMAGSVTVYDPISRKIAQATGCIVVSVEYRLAPESPYPHGLNDAYGVAKNLFSVLTARQINFLPKLSLVGDSAGGALVASVISKAQFDPELTIDKAIMIYPSLDYTLSYPSVEQNAVGYLLQKSKVIWYYDHYFQNAENRKAVSPLFGDFTARMPETLMVTAEFCPLRDEGFAYLEKLREVGVQTTHLHFPDMPHTFMNMEDLVKEECQQVYDAMATFMKGA